MSMSNIEQIRAFVKAAELGSFSAAARHLNKAQSAVSTAVMNLEIDLDVTLFNRSGRMPVLTAQGVKLLEYAQSLLMSSREFEDYAATFNQDVESNLCVAIEQGILVKALLDILNRLSEHYPYVEFELLDPGVNDVARLLEQGRADLGLMIEREDYPQGFHFKGIGHSRLIYVCSHSHPLVDHDTVTHAQLRHYRQLLTRSRALEDTSHFSEKTSPTVWYCESPYVIMELLICGLGWALLPETVVIEKLNTGELVRLNYEFQQADIIQGVDLVWTRNKKLGSCGQWLLNEILKLPVDTWRQS